MHQKRRKKTMNQSFRMSTARFFAASTLSLFGIAGAQAATVVAVAAGTDFLATGQPTYVEILGQRVTLTGVPLRGSTGKPMGSTDTTVQRSQDAVFPQVVSDTSTVSVPITLTALQMTGTFGSAPNSCTMNVTIQGSPASTGTAIVKVNNAGTGGTYTVSFTVQFVATFTPIPPNTSCPATIMGSKTMTLKGGKWSIKPPAGSYKVTGAYPNPNVNVHTGLPPGYVDFFPKGLQEHLAETVAHSVCGAMKNPSTPCK
jgi:hypothetical protein